MVSSQQPDSFNYPLDQMDDTSRHIHSQVAQSQNYRGHLQYLFTEIERLPAGIGNYLASCWSAWGKQVQDHQSAYTALATTISTGSQKMDSTDHDVARGFE